MDKALKYLSDNWAMILRAIAVCIAIYWLLSITGMWDKLLASFKTPPKATGGNSATQPTPPGWTPYADAVTLYNAMSGFGTNEEMIWGALDGKNPDQLAKIYNEFNKLYKGEGNGDLLEWFADDLSGDDLIRAQGYFKNLNFN